MVPLTVPNSVVLPAPFGPIMPERLALQELKVDALGDDDRAETFDDLFKREQRRGHGNYSTAFSAFAF